MPTVRGVLPAPCGRLTVRAHQAVGQLTIETESLDTGNKRRDKHLRSADFLDVERRPRIVFTATTLAKGDGGSTVTGELEIGSTHTQLEIPVNIEQTADGALLHGETTVSRKTAGMAWNTLGMIGDDAMVNAQPTLTRAVS